MDSHNSKVRVGKMKREIPLLEDVIQGKHNITTYDVFKDFDEIKPAHNKTCIMMFPRHNHPYVYHVGGDLHTFMALPVRGSIDFTEARKACQDYFNSIERIPAQDVARLLAAQREPELGADAGMSPSM